MRKKIYNGKTEFHSGIIMYGGMLLVLLLALVSCGSSRNSNIAEKQAEFNEMRDLIASREFEIEHQWAFPLGFSNINLMGNPNFIRFKNDSIHLSLPYFGVRHMGGAYSGEGGIRYEGPVQDLEIKENKNQKNIRISFEGNQDNENLNFILTVFPNRIAETSVTSSERTTISYRGEIEALPKKAKED